jgi:hypothetical protein
MKLPKWGAFVQLTVNSRNDFDPFQLLSASLITRRLTGLDYSGVNLGVDK